MSHPVIKIQRRRIQIQNNLNVFKLDSAHLKSQLTAISLSLFMTSQLFLRTATGIPKTLLATTETKDLFRRSAFRAIDVQIRLPTRQFLARNRVFEKYMWVFTFLPKSHKYYYESLNKILIKKNLKYMYKRTDKDRIIK